MKATDSSAPLPVQPTAPRQTKKLQWGKVLRVVVPVAVLAVLAVGMVRFLDMDALLGGLTRPKLAPAGGKVLYQGEPLRNGQVMTHPMDSRGLPALGWTDDEGKFTLKTDVQGSFVEGATVGVHRVTVTAYQPISGPAAPPLLTPEQYASFGTSPLRITIRANAADNQFEFILDGDAPSRPQGAGQRGGKGGGKGGGGKGKKAKGETPTLSEPEAPVEAVETTDEPGSEPKLDAATSSRDQTQTKTESGKAPANEGTPDQP
jgi:hypothetical protein